jgi:hypothetical protein
MTILSTSLRNGAHYLGCDTQGKPVKTNPVCLPTNPDTDGLDRCNPSWVFKNMMQLFWDLTIVMLRNMVTIMNVPMVPCITLWRPMKQTTMVLGKLWDQIESEQISFSLELICENHVC